MRTLAFVSVLTLTSVAAADIVEPAPTDCAPGAQGRTGRFGPYCEPTACGEGEGECPTEPYCPIAGFPCNDPERWSCAEAPIGLCVRTDRRTDDHPLRGTGEEFELRVAVGPCIDGACPAGGSCEVARRCVHTPVAVEEAPPEEAPSAEEEPPAAEEPAASTEAPPAAGCGCRAAPSTTAPWSLAALALLALRRRATAG